jgi:hypothetical protein
MHNFSKFDNYRDRSADLNIRNHSSLEEIPIVSVVTLVEGGAL